VLERERLIARIRQIRRARQADDEQAKAGSATPEPDPLSALEVRVAHLEALLQGLQDSVHRESERQSKRLADLEARVEPAALGKALSEDARIRGL
jgi:hypothetical protein